MLSSTVMGNQEKKPMIRITFPWEKPMTPIYDIENWNQMAHMLDLLWNKVLNPLPVVSKWRKIIGKETKEMLKPFPQYAKYGNAFGFFRFGASKLF